MQLKINYIQDIDIPEGQEENTFSVYNNEDILKKILKDLNEDFMGGEDLTYDSKLEAVFNDNRLTVKEDNYPI